jgi:hypothetical protein
VSRRPGRTSARGLLAALTVLLLGPGRAAACAVCIGSAFGDRSYSWPYLGLILMPFVVSAVVIGVLAWQFGWRPRHLAARARTALGRAASDDPSPRTHTETT